MIHNIDSIPIPEEQILTSYRTFASAQELIIEAARARRLAIADFVGRSALAVAAYDLDLPWRAVTKTECAIYDLRTQRRDAHHGRHFGAWEIGRIDESR